MFSINSDQHRTNQYHLSLVRLIPNQAYLRIKIHPLQPLHHLKTNQLFQINQQILKDPTFTGYKFDIRIIK